MDHLLYMDILEWYHCYRRSLFGNLYEFMKVYLYERILFALELKVQKVPIIYLM